MSLDMIKNQLDIMKQNGTPLQQTPDLTPDFINKVNEWANGKINQIQQNGTPLQEAPLNFNLQQWLTDRFNDTKTEIGHWFTDRWHELIHNGQVADSGQYGDGILIELLIIIAIIGVFAQMAGFKSTGNKMILGSVLGALIWTVIFHA